MSAVCCLSDCQVHSVLVFVYYHTWLYTVYTLSTIMLHLVCLSDSPVPLSDLAYLSNLPVAAEWMRLGLQLGVPGYQLDTIQTDHAGQPCLSARCLCSMFDWWLNNSDSPTPRQLATALSTIEKRDVAESVAQKYGMSSVIY